MGVAAKPVFDDQFIAANAMPVPDTGCWLWERTVEHDDYATFAYRRGVPRAVVHREVWKHRNGPIPEGLVIRHQCDIPSCIAPNHLLLGTQKDNTDDCRRRNRLSWGERHYQHKLKEYQVREIRSSAVSNAALAKTYGVAPGTVWEIKHRKIWKHLA